MSIAAGQWVTVLHEDELMVGTVVDLQPNQTPNKVRIQRGRLQGRALEPTEYRLRGRADEEDLSP